MCATCGCSSHEEGSLTDLQTGAHAHLDGQEGWHHHDAGVMPGHSHSPGLTDSLLLPSPGLSGSQEPHRILRLEQEILSRNDRTANQNRSYFASRNVAVWNLVSSPGSGKTTLLEKTIQSLSSRRTIEVIEGDQASLLDGQRIRATGVPVIQINTGNACHLDASMVMQASHRLNPEPGSWMFVENVGNLVCPALFDLGETARILIASVTEGDDKPAKYPPMFRSADLVLLNKMDLLPHVPFSVDKFTTALRGLNPKAEVIPISAMKGEGMSDWIAWLERKSSRSLFA